jgi:RimJ/RimL family protein N-acetyltransferase
VSESEQTYTLRDGRNVVLRTAKTLTEEDQGHLVDLFHSVSPDELLFLPETLTIDRIMRRWEADLEAGGGVTVVGQIDGKIVGHAAIHRLAAQWLRHVGEIDLLVASDYRGSGLGEQLAKAAIGQAREAGFEKLSVDMSAAQERPIALFKKLGFQQEGIRRAHARDRDGNLQDMVMMGRMV